MRKRRNDNESVGVQLGDLPVAALLVDGGGRVESWNRAAARLLGGVEEVLAGASVAHVLDRDPLGVDVRTELRARIPECFGGPIDVIVHRSLLDGDPLGRLLIVLEPASTLATAGGEARAPRVHQWTELADRVRLIPGTAVCATFGLVGLDAVNQTFSRSTGDRVLTTVIERLRELAPPGAVVERTGGERFVVVTGADVDAGLWSRLVEALRSPVDTPLGRVAVGSSVGVADGDPRSPIVLLDRAERRLESALRRGAGIVEDHHMVERVVVPSARVAGQLVDAVAAGGVRAHFQPVLDLLDHRVVEFEALARWDDDGDSHRAAAEFIGAAADTGVLVPLGAGVLRDAVELARSIVSTIGERSFAVSVNVSIRELLDPSYLDLVGALLAQTGVCPSVLQIEVPAAIPLGEVRSVAERVDELRTLGVRVALDNVGGVGSSMVVLSQIAADVFKLDPGLLEHLDRDTSAEQVLRSMLDLGRQLGIAVVAKGVEDASQHELLRSLGCRFGQGFHYGAAVPALELPFEDLVGPPVELLGRGPIGRRTTTVARLIAAGAFDHRGLDDLVLAAADVAASTMAAISVLDHEMHWLASCTGLQDVDRGQLTAMCALALDVDEALTVPDLAAIGNGRLGPAADLVDAGVGAFVGVPIRIGGVAVGTLCVLWPTVTLVPERLVNRLRWLAGEAATRVEVRGHIANGWPDAV